MDETTEKKKRNRLPNTTRLIADEEYICPALAAKFIGCSRSTLQQMIERSRHGLLKPPLEWYRDKPKSPIWFRKAFLVEWARKRGAMHV
ncbi:hypothetical protein [Fibrobacter sp. UWH4]|uniref:hypothetical protein n=1 Tax=Fibrobacter sp. UWH4 TaxID=1896210 RepID=UPI000920D818|nr:hypothetical protein [Fibrobacter sp. UWH4]SHL05431.1 hypothetical protein SAMN05720762_10470 [Fibrobacter sp. UWH4]